MLPRLVVGKLNSIHGILYLYEKQNIACAGLFLSFSLKLLMKVVQSYLYPKAHIPLCPMGYPVNVRLFLYFFLFEI